MKHALTVIVLAGIGGAAWYHVDHSARQPTARLQIPDPGPSYWEADGLRPRRSADWQPVDLEPLVPLEPAVGDLVAERPARVKAVSDEQPFAVSEEDDRGHAAPAESSRGKARRTSTGNRQETDEPAHAASSTTSEFRSVEGRTISVRRLGEGRYRTVIITGIDGRDRTAVQWSDELADALEQRSDLLQQQEFIIIRAANPDGLAARTRENAQGVVLNRNFPTRRFRLDPAGANGTSPASEPETRALLQTLYDVRPQRVVHIFSTTGKTAAYVNQPAADVAERLNRLHNLPTERLNFDYVPGSVEEFADATLNAGIVRLHLKGVPDDEVARSITPVLLSAVAIKEADGKRSGTVAPVSTPRREPSRWQNGPTSSPVPTSPNQQGGRRSRPVIHRGYEELPPPPQ